MCNICKKLDTIDAFDLTPFMPARQAQFNKLKPTFITSAHGLDWYEHPIFGDEMTLIVLIGHLWYDSDEWEI